LTRPVSAEWLGGWCWVMGAVWLLVLLWLLMLLLPFCWVLALRRVCCCFCCRAQIVRLLRVRRLAALERQKEFTDRGGTAPPAGAAKTTTVRSHCPANHLYGRGLLDPSSLTE